MQIKQTVEVFKDKYYTTITGCWVWTGGDRKYTAKPNRYPRLKYKRKWFSAHRLSWTLFRGPIPSKLFVLHICDNTTCVNPNHLFLGTASDNMIDRESKNRAKHARGVDCGAAKLTEEKIRKIRSLYDTNSMSLRAIARLYNMSYFAIRSAAKRLTWRHV